MPHVLVDISSHGFGHLSQTAPVLAAVRACCPDLRITVCSGLARTRLARRIDEPFAHVHAASDFGFVMHNAVDIDFAVSAQRYRSFHAEWTERVAAYATLLNELQADIVVANAAYLPLAAARAANVPALGFCSLNWADLFQHYFGDAAWAAPVHRQMLDAYAAAHEFLIVTPGMPMAGFPNARPVGPVAALRERSLAQRARLAARLGIAADETWVVLAMGGVEFRLPVETWPELPGVRFLCPAGWGMSVDASHPGSALHSLAPAPDATHASRNPGRRPASADFCDDDFADLLANADVVLTKPGYGTFVEAACHGTAVLYVPRDDWPEEAPLVEWLKANGRAVTIDRSALERGDLARPLARLLAQSVPARPHATGNEQIAEAIVALLPNGCRPRDSVSSTA